MNLKKIEHGFPYLTKTEVPLGEPRIYISWHTEQRFKSGWDRVDENEKKKKVHRTNLVYTRLLGEFWAQGMDLPNWLPSCSTSFRFFAPRRSASWRHDAPFVRGLV
jgi:hypothetical protein